MSSQANDLKPTVSVVMANYNGARYLAGSIESLRQQTLQNIEIIVADDASTDDSVTTVEKLMELDSRIHLIRCQSNRGPAAARNVALEAVSGEWIAIVDSDDYVHPQRLETLVGVAQREGADIIADDLLVVDIDHTKPARTLLFGSWKKAPFWIDIVDYVRLNRIYGRGPALGYLKPILHTSILRDSIIRYDETLRIAEDYDFVLRLLYVGRRMIVHPVPLYIYRKHQISISYRLTDSALVPLLLANQRFFDRLDHANGRLRAAVATQIKSVETAIAYGRLLQALKAKDFRRAVAIAVSQPRAAALLRLPLGVSLRNLVVPKRQRDAITASARSSPNNEMPLQP